MYLPSKPVKYELKIISLCDARTFYFCRGIPYIGKETLVQNNLFLPTQYAPKLDEPIMGTNRNIITDNWFTSLELAEKLLAKQFTLVGTLRKKKRDVSLHMFGLKNLQFTFT